MKRILLFDPIKCTGCRVCEIICSLRHTGECNPARSRVKILEKEEGGICISIRCRRCKKPPCIEACPVGAMSQDAQTGVIRIDEELCIGCVKCVEACPFGAMSLDPVTDNIIVCDLCDGEPACALYCVTGATRYVRADEIGIEKGEKVAAG